MKELKVVAFEMGKEPRLVTMKNDLKVFQNFVGGYIEAFCQPDGIIIICNEEGKLKGLPINKIMFGEPIAGNFFICRSDKKGDFADVTDEDISFFIFDKIAALNNLPVETYKNIYELGSFDKSGLIIEDGKITRIEMYEESK